MHKKTILKIFSLNAEWNFWRKGANEYFHEKANLKQSNKRKRKLTDNAELEKEKNTLPETNNYIMKHYHGDYGVILEVCAKESTEHTQSNQRSHKNALH